MRVKLPQYSGKDHVVLAIITIPITLALNSIIFGSRYFTHTTIFLAATILTAAIFFIYYVVCGFIAMWLKYRLPMEEQTPMRLFLMIVSFIMLSGIFLLILFNGYEIFPSFEYVFYEQGFIWAYVGLAILNIFLTLLMEGIYRYNHWLANLQETEQIKKAYTQSQLIGLKSQVNPHFLFNSLNTLSSLISEDEKAAETFLDEMCKVYRYMLRGDDEQLVTLQTELKFVSSYLHLLKKRFGQSLEVNTDIYEEDRQKFIPPLTLQVLIENAFTQNSMSKNEPLVINIASKGANELLISNNRRPKAVTNALDVENSLDNIVTKYKFLNASNVIIKDDEQQRYVLLPLFKSTGGYV